MGIFGSVFGGAKRKVDEASKRFDGTTDFLEGVAAGCAFMASADGEIDAGEKKKALDVMLRMDGISGKFDARRIEEEFEKRCRQTTDRSGRADLAKEIGEVGKRDDTGVLAAKIVYAALDVADATGGISDVEKARGEKLAEMLGISAGRDSEMLAA